MEPIFIYYDKGKNKIKALPLEEASICKDDLLKKGFIHTATIDACKWIEKLFNNNSQPADTFDCVRELIIK